MSQPNFLRQLYSGSTLHAGPADVAAGDVLQILGIAPTDSRRHRIAERIEAALDHAHLAGHRQAKQDLKEAYQAVAGRMETIR